jgi:hypothetical protein
LTLDHDERDDARDTGIAPMRRLACDQSQDGDAATAMTHAL